MERLSELTVPAVGSGLDQTEIPVRQATAVGERIALALANLRLRECFAVNPSGTH